MELTRSELDVLQILINSKKPISKVDILDASTQNKTWKDSSIHILLNGLLKKNAIKEVGFIRSGKGYGRTFSPTKAGEEYISNLLIGLSKHANISSVLSHLVNNNELSDAELAELEKIIQSGR